MSSSADAVNINYQTSRPSPPDSVLAPSPLKPKRLHYGDPLRILGTMAVVLGHNVDMAMGGPVFTREWWVINFTDAFTRWAVPVYIMLSGALLLEPSRNDEGVKFYKKRMARIGVPLVFWTAFFMWFQVEYTGWSTWSAAGKLLALGKPYVHLHFIFRIAGLYFFTPMLRVWLAHTPRRMQWLAVIGMLALAGGDTIMNGITGNEPSVFVRFVPFLGYYLLGYLLRETQVSPLGLAWCWLGAIGSCILLAYGTGWLIAKFPNPEDSLSVAWYPSIQMTLYDFTSPLRIVMAICVWLIFVHSFRNPWPKSTGGRKVLAFWASTTLGLYLIHPMFREILYTGRIAVPTLVRATWFTENHFLPRIHYFQLKTHTVAQLQESLGPLWHGWWIGIPVVAIMIYVLSLVSTIILMRIPWVRRITG